MGQRSQIYIRYQDHHGTQLIARYFGWNYGVRMVSRARGIIEWLTDYMEMHKDYLPGFFNDRVKMETLVRICETNFDMRDVIFSGDIKEEIVSQFAKEAEKNGLALYLFGQPNNDGQLLIDIVGNEIKYAFIKYYTDIDRAMDGNAYLRWDEDQDWRSKYLLYNNNAPKIIQYTEDNLKYISEHAKLMTSKEVMEYVEYDYSLPVFGYPMF